MNVEDIEEYLRRVEAGEPAAGEAEQPDRQATACETAVLNLRRIKGIDLAEYRQRTGYEARELFAGVIERQVKANMMEMADGCLRLTRAALPVADGVLAEFASL